MISLFSAFVFSAINPAMATNGLLTETAIEGGYECVYEQCSYIDEEGYEQAGGPNFTMLSTTPCPASVDAGPTTGKLVDVRKVHMAHTTAELVPLLPEEPIDDGGIQAAVQICFPLPGLTFCYIDTAPSCYDWTLSQPGGTNPEGYTCDDVI